MTTFQPPPGYSIVKLLSFSFARSSVYRTLPFWIISTYELSEGRYMKYAATAAAINTAITAARVILTPLVRAYHLCIHRAYIGKRLADTFCIEYFFIIGDKYKVDVLVAGIVFAGTFISAYEKSC